MKQQRQERYQEREQQIVAVAQNLLLDNLNFTLDEVAKELDLAKGTLYKHFSSKNELLMHLIIDNEKSILKISQQYHTDIKEYILRYMLYHLLSPKRIIILHQIEEQLTMTVSQASLPFAELYQIRQERIMCIREMVEKHLTEKKYDVSIRDYSSYVWSLTFGACLLLNSSYYQRYIGSRETLINLYLNQALNFPEHSINIENMHIWDGEQNSSRGELHSPIFISNP